MYCDPLAPTATTECKSHYQTRRLAAGVVTGTPVFAYYDRDGNPLTVAAGGLTADELSGVLAVQISLTVQSTTVTKARPTTYVQRITLPNAQAVLRPGSTLTAGVTP